MFPLLFLLINIPLFESLKFSSVDDIPSVDVSKESRTLWISKEDLLVVLQLEPNYVILGGRNFAYNVSLWDINIRHSVNWPTNNSTRHECSLIISSNCDNFIRSFYKTKDGFVLCGTHGQRPMCKRYTGGWADPRPADTFPGEGLSPFSPLVKAPFVNADGRIFTINAPEYSASTDAILLRKTINKKEKAIRTARGESAFDMAQFVSLEDNNKEVLAFFSELPTDAEGSGLRRVARVARVCKDDPGATSFSDEWSSFVKARLECSVTQDGYDSLLFNQLTSLVSSPSLFAGVFRSQLAGLGFSAICLYPRPMVSSTLSSVFPVRTGCPRATDDSFQRNLRGNPLIQKKVKTEPVFVYSGQEDVASMAILHNVTDLSGMEYNIFFLGTTTGKILKIVIGRGVARHVATISPFSTKKSPAISQLWLKQERLANQKTTTALFALTDSAVTKVPSSVCGSAPNCSSCLSMGDPQCAWILHGAECVSVEENFFRREYLTQQIDKCPRVPVTAEIKKSQLSVPCLCQKPVECVTQLIQKELQPISTAIWIEKLFYFAVGLLVGALINCFFINYCTNKPKKPGRLSAFSSPVRQSSSMHSSLHTYC